MDDNQLREEFDTGISKIKHEIKSRLAAQGFFGTVTNTDLSPVDDSPSGATIQIAVKGRIAGRSFDRKQIVGCRLRVGGDVLVGIIAMVDELAA